MLTFSNWIADDEKLAVRGSPNLKSTLGYAMLVTIIIYILINLSILGRAVLKIALEKLKNWYTIKMRLREIEL